MYVIGSEQCSMPNSESPISQQAIDQETAFLTSANTAMDDGNIALNSLLEALGGNPAGDTVSGAQGVPTTGTLDTSSPGIPVVPQPPNAPNMAMLPDVNDPNFWGWGDSPVPSRVTSGARRMRGKNAARYGNVPVQQDQTPPSGCPVVVPLVTAIPLPSVSPVTPAAAAPPPAPPASTPVADCRTGNWCLDIMNGCVLSSQVDIQQLQACSAAGYAGNRNLYPAIAAKGGAGNGASFGTPDPNPAPYSPGMSGFGQDTSAQASNAGIFSSAFEYAISGLIAVVATTLFVKMGKKR
jgi:hypothetical protein